MGPFENAWIIPVFLITAMIAIGLPVIFFGQIIRKARAGIADDVAKRVSASTHAQCECPHCHNRIPDMGRYCPVCGRVRG